MASPDILDFEVLLQPISDENPGGENLREDISPTSVYYQIKDARAAARAAERSANQAGEGEDGAASHWKTMLELGPGVLATRSKDLEIVAWMIEALVREHGFAGLRDGFRLASELVERFWDHLHPMPDEDGLETRVAPLSGLNGEGAEGTLQVPIALAPITYEADNGSFSLWRFQKAQELSRIEDADVLAERIEAGNPTLDQFQDTVRLTPPEFFTELLDDLDVALRWFEDLCRLLDDHCGADAPPASALRSVLTEARQTIHYVVMNVAGLPDPDVASVAEEVPEEAEDDSESAEEGAPAPAAPPGEIRTREEAFRQMTRIADYFRRTEPHSPLSTMLTQAVRWGQMPLERLVEELIPDDDARAHFSLMTGMRRIDDGASSDSTDDDL